jgi:hypothetical protein
MKASELRIGNIISWISSGNIENVIKIDINYINDVSESDLNPIELTSEWLLKFECNSIVSKKRNFCIDWRIGDKFEITEIHFNYFIYYVKNEDPIYVTSVHQLQNLYFALTGKELKLIEE